MGGIGLGYRVFLNGCALCGEPHRKETAVTREVRAVDGNIFPLVLFKFNAYLRVFNPQKERPKHTPFAPQITNFRQFT